MPRILDRCPGCGRQNIAHRAKGLCAMCFSRKRRKDPAEVEKDKRSNRTWKAKHKGEPRMARLLDRCPGCGRQDIAHRAQGLCAMCYSRKRRKDPIKAEKDRAVSRAWKANHPGHDRRPNYVQRPPAFQIPLAYPIVLAFCKGCGIRMLDPALLCGFCQIELPAYDKLRLMELLPTQDQQWYEYFSLLTNRELDELLNQGYLEKARRIKVHCETVILPQMTDLYRRDGAGNLIEAPPHHRRCRTCNELVVNCKGHPQDAAA